MCVTLQLTKRLTESDQHTEPIEQLVAINESFEIGPATLVVDESEDFQSIIAFIISFKLQKNSKHYIS